MADETGKMIWYSDVWIRRFVVWIAGTNPAGAEPSEWAAELEDGGSCLYRSAPGFTSEVVNPADETEQLIWRSYVWSRRFVVCIAGMTPAGVEPSLRAAASKGDQKFRYQLGARFADSVQQRRSAVLEQESRAQLDASEATEQTIWYSDLWSRRFVALNAGYEYCGRGAQ